ncbi:hypothetical protein [Kordia sp.]|uniref:hypothetical protein n=1 Tax=Kordia sp. TaxID=1965332 RepID=UPI003D29614C
MKSLMLHKHTVSNLAILHRKTGGVTVLNTDGQTAITPYGETVNNTDCEHITTNTLMISDCIGTLCAEQCHTNAGTTRAQPPSEHQGCNINSNGNSAHMHQG